MKLYHNPASPFVRKVRVVAAECGIADQLQLEEVVLTPVNTPDQLASDNPLGKIPALQLDNGQCLYDSRVICEYLDAEFQGDLYPIEGWQRWQVLRLQAMADGLCYAAVLVRYEGFVRPIDKQWSQWIEAQLAKCRRAIAQLEQDCAQYSDQINIGTLSIAIALGYLDFRNPDEAWRDYAPSLASWYAGFSQRASLQQTLPA